MSRLPGAETNTTGEPVAIGGLGGSGTRVVAQILGDLGFHLGSDLNRPLDNLWFTLLFKRTEILDVGDTEFELLVGILLNGISPRRDFSPVERSTIARLASKERLHHPVPWLAHRAESLLAQPKRGFPIRRAWGWKEPNTHLVADRLLGLLPGLKYVHVIRNGLDMAYSRNQNQLRFWGESLLGPDETQVTLRNSLRFWCVIHQRLLQCARIRPGRILLLNYDRLCRDPSRALGSLLQFLDLRRNDSEEYLARRVVPPPSIGRFKAASLDAFEPADVDFVRSLGFDTSPG